MIEYLGDGQTETRAERLLVLTSDHGFGTELIAALDRAGRLVEQRSSLDTAQFDATRHDGLVVDHDGETVDAAAVVEALGTATRELTVVVRGPADAGGLASAVLAAGATTFVAGDAATVADRTDAAIDERRETARAARATTYRAVAEDALGSGDVGLLLSDYAGTIRWATDSVGTFFDVSPDRLVGTPRRRSIREQLARSVTESSSLTETLLSGGEYDRVLVRTDRLATARWLDCQSAPVTDGPFAGGRIDRFVDVTQFVRTDDGLRDLQQLMVSPEVAFAERLHEALALGSDRLDLPYGFVTAIGDGTQDVLDAVGDHPQLQPGESTPVLQTYCRKTLAADDLVAIPDAVEAGWEHDPAYETFDLGSYIGAPVVSDGDHYGTLCFAASEPREPFADEETLFVKFAAAWAGWELGGYDTADS